jgi:hypothetical protein
MKFMVLHHEIAIPAIPFQNGQGMDRTGSGPRLSTALLPVSFLLLVATALRLDLKSGSMDIVTRGILNTSAKGS